MAVPSQLLATVASCTFFMACSAGMMIVNKMVMQMIHLPITVVIIQMAFTVLVLVAYPCGLHFGSRKDVVRWGMTVPWLFALMLASSMLSLHYSSMGAIVVVRNMSPLISLCIEGLFTGEKIEIDSRTLLSLVVILVGVLLYVSHDISFSPIGMICMFTNLAAGVSIHASCHPQGVSPPEMASSSGCTARRPHALGSYAPRAGFRAAASTQDDRSGTD